MFKQVIASFIIGMMVLSVSACSTSQESSEAGAIVEDPTGSGEEITNLEDGAVIVGDDYVSENANAEIEAAEKAKLEALKQDATIYFGFDSETIANDFVALLQAHAEFLRNNPNIKVIIEGHTDERGTPEYNVALGERRTRSVAQYLMNLGVSVDQLSIVSYGEETPAEVGHSEAFWSKNRRAVINY